MKNYMQTPLAELLQDRDVFGIFDEEFQKESWLDVTVLVHSECSIDEIIKDGSIPPSVLERIVKSLDAL